MPFTPAIFFSYAWGDANEQGESREKLVNELYESLLKDHYQVIRDKYNLGYKGFISEFMTQIGKGKCIVVAVSQKYVRSPYCMFELYEIARNSNFDKHLFRQKVLPVMIETMDFTKPKAIDELFIYWEHEFKEWDSLMKRRRDQLSIEQMQRYDKIKMIRQNIGKLVDWLADMNTLSPKLLSQDHFSEIKKEIARMTEVLSAEDKSFKETGSTFKEEPQDTIGKTATITINNEGAKIGQQNNNATVNNNGANFNIN